ncbi:MAG TPA: hypothetical protein VGZ00_08090 [Candidatus Baltobacteraceae bacterium]|nr:hypothetical protein [Candidatus Baltobacteraceae bacterium]
MPRTSVSHEDDALKALNLLAATSSIPTADKIREAVDIMVAAQIGTIDWKREIDDILSRSQGRDLPDPSGQEIINIVRSARQADDEHLAHLEDEHAEEME